MGMRLFGGTGGITISRRRHCAVQAIKFGMLIKLLPLSFIASVVLLAGEATNCISIILTKTREKRGRDRIRPEEKILAICATDWITDGLVRVAQLPWLRGFRIGLLAQWRHLGPLALLWRRHSSRLERLCQSPADSLAFGN